MKTVSTSFTVADYCAGMDRCEIIVNREYQRSDQVWPQAARSYLIETIVKGFPVPKFYLYQVTDLKSKKTIKEIVDGQQRSHAIHDFMNDKFRIARSADDEDIKNRKYSELDEDCQRRFIDYSISADLFVAATKDEVVETFRRMNSYTVPLNHEEQRHARFQGKFKWFINDLAGRLGAIFLSSGIFKEKQLVRMADNKLLTELSDSFLYGIRTTNKKILDKLYENRDEDFRERSGLEHRLATSFDLYKRMEPVHRTALAAPHMVYSLIQAVAHLRKPVPKFQRLFKSPRLEQLDLDAAMPGLTALARAVEDDDGGRRFAKFLKASSEKTNVKWNREVRFRRFCRVLAGQQSS